MKEIAILIRDIPNFPKEGIVFKDITPLFQSYSAMIQTKRGLVDQIETKIKKEDIDVIVGLESRGFLFGPMLACDLEASFVLARKPGKLPYKKISHNYDLEYGSATIEMHIDSINPGDTVIIHDDLLATGGTALAAAELVKKLGGIVIGFSFIIELEFLGGASKLKAITDNVFSLLKY